MTGASCRCASLSLCLQGRGAEYIIDFVPKIIVEIVIDDALVGRAVEAIQHAARTDKIGDGKIFVSAVSEAIRIRTGEKGTDAIWERAAVARAPGWRGSAAFPIASTV